MPRIRGVRKGYSRLLRDYGFVRILQPEIEERNQRAGTKQRQGHEGQAGDGKHYIKDELHGASSSGSTRFAIADHEI